MSVLTKTYAFSRPTYPLPVTVLYFNLVPLVLILLPVEAPDFKYSSTSVATVLPLTVVILFAFQIGRLLTTSALIASRFLDPPTLPNFFYLLNLFCLTSTP